MPKILPTSYCLVMLAALLVLTASKVTAVTFAELYQVKPGETLSESLKTGAQQVENQTEATVYTYKLADSLGGNQITVKNGQVIKVMVDVMANDKFLAEFAKFGKPDKVEVGQNTKIQSYHSRGLMVYLDSKNRPLRVEKYQIVDSLTVDTAKNNLSSPVAYDKKDLAQADVKAPVATTTQTPTQTPAKTTINPVVSGAILLAVMVLLVVIAVKAGYLSKAKPTQH